MATVVFCHGKESGPNGTKIRYLAPLAEKRGWKVLAPDFSDLPDPEARVDRLLAACGELARPLVLVGSSMGGYVAIRASGALRPEGLLLLAPAVGLPGYPQRAPRPRAEQIAVIHGWGDDVIPADIAIDWARSHRLELHLVDDVHVLTGRLEFLGDRFEVLLTAVENRRREVECP
ncbi:alpha/beta superfamily hydrolase [Geothermobacter ehrlichii]|uniref:Alpha/beta superfamily hydrolase n=1 Tax=Geothermobacter ehrlichii TaxID=213224 RepID=A0A5D3WP56_9BACT|nr:alpha/beta hydrolase [Geothermobacter ehrlichii]TYO99986.1 alpha/beta superfamily hydrolase [Geothermobacter ehrlichii]